MTEFINYPMGPNLRKWLQLPTTEARVEATDAEAISFSAWLSEQMSELSIGDLNLKVSLMDELVSMNLPLMTLKLADAYNDLDHTQDFRGLLSEGIAAMITGDLDRAESTLALAQEVMPEEPAPYVNLCRILLAQDRFDEAMEWWQAGLDIEHNNHNLWGIAQDFAQQGLMKFDDVLIEAKKRDSWVGHSLAADLQEQPFVKADFLEEFYKSGERSAEFLMEYTGTLGQAGDFESIPGIIWEAEGRMGADKMPWKLYLHGAQAQLAQEKFPAFEELARKAQKCADLPQEISQQIDQLIQDEIANNNQSDKGKP